MDAPLHIFENGCALDEMPAEQFVGAGLIVDCSHLTSGQQIGLKEIDAKRKLADKADFLCFIQVGVVTGEAKNILETSHA